MTPKQGRPRYSESQYSGSKCHRLKVASGCSATGTLTCPNDVPRLGGVNLYAHKTVEFAVRPAFVPKSVGCWGEWAVKAPKLRKTDQRIGKVRYSTQEVGTACLVEEDKGS